MNILSKFGIPARLVIASAHRTPHKAAALAAEARARGVRVIIAAAGYAAHLGGALAAHTTLPVIGVPLDGSSLKGMDSLLSIVQMPSGVPVATVSIGKTGAENAAILATQILATSDDNLAKKLEEHKKNMVEQVEKANEDILK
jgi:phosphoribosylaminoimidazole carboxylase PurE protein